MPNIKPVSDLRNYGEVLRDVAVGQPVFLTNNNRRKELKPVIFATGLLFVRVIDWKPDHDKLSIIQAYLSLPESKRIFLQIFGKTGSFWNSVYNTVDMRAWMQWRAVQRLHRKFE